MDYRIIAQEELKNIDMLRTALRNTRTELNGLNAELRNIKSSKTDSVRGAFDPHSGENRVVSLLMRKDDILHRARQTQMRIDRVDSALNAVSDEDRTLLIACFAEEKSPDDLMFDMGIERSAFYRRRGEALDRFTRALYGVILT